MKTMKHAIIGLACLLGMSSAAQAADVQLIQSLESDKRIVRPQAGYDLGYGVGGFSFVELYGDGYFGKTTLSREVLQGIEARARATYGSGFQKYEAGIAYQVPLSKGKVLNVHYLKGVNGNESTTLGYFALVSLPKDVTLSSFADFTIDDGIDLGYGELDLSKKITDRVAASYNVAATKDDLEHRVILTIGL